MLSSRKSERSKTRRTTWCSISSPRPPGRTSRSAGRSWAPGRASRPSTGRRSISISSRRYSAGATVVAAAGAVEHDHILDLAQSRLGTLSRRAGAGRSASRLSRRRDQGEAAPRADPCRGGLRGPCFERAGSRRRPGLRRRRGRGHVVAALSGGARKTGPRLLDLWIPLGLHRHGPVRLLRRLGRQRCGGGGRGVARLPCAKPRTGSRNRKFAAPRRR